MTEEHGSFLPDDDKANSKTKEEDSGTRAALAL